MRRGCERALVVALDMIDENVLAVLVMSCEKTREGQIICICMHADI